MMMISYQQNNMMDKADFMARINNLGATVGTGWVFILLMQGLLCGGGGIIVLS